MQRDVLQAFSPPGPRQSVVTLSRILFLQTVAGLLFASAVTLVSGQVAGIAALIGLALCVLPNLLFALRIIPGMFQDSPEQVMNGVYTAETIKLATTVLLFVLVFKFLQPLRPDMLFAGFVVTQFSIILAAWVAD